MNNCFVNRLKSCLLLLGVIKTPSPSFVQIHSLLSFSSHYDMIKSICFVFLTIKCTKCSTKIQFFHKKAPAFLWRPCEIWLKNKQTKTQVLKAKNFNVSPSQTSASGTGTSGIQDWGNQKFTTLCNGDTLVHHCSTSPVRVEHFLQDCQTHQNLRAEMANLLSH